MNRTVFARIRTGAAVLALLLIAMWSSVDAAEEPAQLQSLRRSYEAAKAGALPDGVSTSEPPAGSAPQLPSNPEVSEAGGK